METRGQHIFIGLFVLIMIGIAATSVFWLGRLNDQLTYNRYNVDFVEGVSGLSRKAPVVVNGINVGRVESVSLHPNDINRVRVIIAVDERIPVLTSTKVSLSLQGVSGFGVDISTTDQNAPLLEPLEGEDYPTINVERSQVSQLLETVPNMLRNVNVLIAKLDDVLTQNNDTIGKSLGSVEKGLNFLIDRTADFENILADVQVITKNSIKISADVTEITTNVSAITADVSKQIDPMIVEVNATIAEYKALAATLDKVMQGEGATMIAQINETLAEYKKIGAGVNEVINSDAKGMIAKVETAIGEFNKLGDSVNKLLDEDGDDMLGEVKTIIAEYKKLGSNVNILLEGDAAKLLVEANAAIGEFKELGGNVNAIVNNDGQKLVANVNTALEEVTLAVGGYDKLGGNVNKLFEAGEGNLVADVAETLAEFKKLGGNLNELLDDDAAKILTEVNATVAEYKKIGVGVNKLVDNDGNDIVAEMSSAVKSFNVTLDEYKQIAQSVNKFLASDDMAAGNKDIGKMLGGTMESINTTVKSFEKMTLQLEQLIAAVKPGLSRFSGSGLRDAETLLKQSKATLNSFNRLIRQVESNPQRFLFGDKRTPKYRPN